MKRLSLIFIALSIYLLFPNISHTADIIITVAGTGTSGYSGDNGPAIEAQTSPTGVSANSSGDLFIAEFANNCIRKVDRTTGIITTVAGVCGATGGYSGDGGSATSANLNGPYSVFVNNSDIFIADFNNNRVRKVSGGIISTVAGNGTGLNLENARCGRYWSGLSGRSWSPRLCARGACRGLSFLVE